MDTRPLCILSQFTEFAIRVSSCQKKLNKTKQRKTWEWRSRSKHIFISAMKKSTQLRDYFFYDIKRNCRIPLHPHAWNHLKNFLSTKDLLKLSSSLQYYHISIVHLMHYNFECLCQCHNQSKRKGNALGPQGLDDLLGTLHFVVEDPWAERCSKALSKSCSRWKRESLKSNTRTSPVHFFHL